jgi:molybdenum cofactor cytidylyltransferase
MQGILLAAGIGRRFQARDHVNQDKLLVAMPRDEKSVLWYSANALIKALPNSIAVIQPQQTERKELLKALGFMIVESKRAEHGMGYAIADAIKATKFAQGWLITLADMPWVTTALIEKIVAGVNESSSVVAPRYNQKRGQPVAFGAAWFEQLASLQGDIGARDLLKSADINWIDWHDNSIHRDVDTIQDINTG